MAAGKLPEGHRLPSLLVSREQAADRIALQIEKGRTIADSRINSRGDLEQAKSERTKWRKYSKEMLSRLFDDTSYAGEFERTAAPAITGGRPDLGSEVVRFRRSTSREVAVLESIADRLELIHAVETNQRTGHASAGRTDRLEVDVVFEMIVADKDVANASRQLFIDKHYAQAIFEAFKVVNLIVKRLSGIGEKDGKDLMFSAFNPLTGPLRLSPDASVSARDEQEGFMHIYAGAIQGIRNPKAHDVVEQTDSIRTLQYLALASLLVTRAKEAQRTASVP